MSNSEKKSPTLKEMTPGVTIREMKLSPPNRPDLTRTGHHVIVENDSGIWEEFFATDIELDAFIRGLRAGVAMLGSYIEPPRLDPNNEPS